MALLKAACCRDVPLEGHDRPVVRVHDVVVGVPSHALVVGAGANLEMEAASLPVVRGGTAAPNHQSQTEQNEWE